jgi:hypothetical protein
MASKVELELIALTRKAGGDIDKFASGASSAMNALKVVAAAALAVFASRKILGAVTDVTKAASIQEDAVNSLNSSLKLAGDFSVEASADLQKFAADLQGVTTIGDETSLRMLALAKSFGVTNEDAKKLVTAAADLSEVTGMSLDSAVRNLGKTYGGLTGELGEVIPALKDLTKEQLQSGAALDFVSKRFGGAAEAATNTYSGAVKQLTNSFGDFKEELGFIITESPDLINLIKGLKDSFGLLGKFVNDNADSVRDLIGSGLKKLIIEMDIVGKSAKSLIDSFGRLTDVFGDIGLATDKSTDAYRDHLGVIGNVTRGVLLIEGAFLSATNGILAAVAVIPGADKLFGDLTEAAKNLSDKMIENKKALIDLETPYEMHDMALERVRKEYEQSQRSVEDLTGSVKKMREEVAKPVEFKIDEDWWRQGAGTPGNKGFVGPLPQDTGPTVRGGIGGDLFSEIPLLNDLKAFGKAVNDTTKAIGMSVLQNITKGKAGGQAVLGAAATAGATAFGLPPQIAGPLGSIVTDLAGATKEEAEQMARDFALGITEGIKALVENAPAFITALAENSGEIITAIIAAIPDIIVAFVKAQPMIAEALVMELVNGIKFQMENIGPSFTALADNFKEGFQNATQGLIDGVTNFPTAFGEQLPKLAEDFASSIGSAFKSAFESGGELIKDIGTGFKNAATTFVTELVAKAREVVDALTPKPLKDAGLGKGKGGIFGGTVVPGFLATGGFVKGSGVKDTVPAMLTPGELVIDRTTGPRLNRFLDSAEGGGGSNDVLLSRILDLLERPQTVQTEVRLDNRVLADIILQLNRSGARLTA